LYNNNIPYDSDYIRPNNIYKNRLHGNGGNDYRNTRRHDEIRYHEIIRHDDGLQQSYKRPSLSHSRSKSDNKYSTYYYPRSRSPSYHRSIDYIRKQSLSPSSILKHGFDDYSKNHKSLTTTPSTKMSTTSLKKKDLELDIIKKSAKKRSENYNQILLEPSIRIEEPPPMLIVLDLNGTLVYRDGEHRLIHLHTTTIKDRNEKVSRIILNEENNNNNGNVDEAFIITKIKELTTLKKNLFQKLQLYNNNIPYDSDYIRPNNIYKNRLHGNGGNDYRNTRRHDEIRYHEIIRHDDGLQQSYKRPSLSHSRSKSDNKYSTYYYPRSRSPSYHRSIDYIRKQSLSPSSILKHGFDDYSKNHKSLTTTPSTKMSTTSLKKKDLELDIIKKSAKKRSENYNQILLEPSIRIEEPPPMLIVLDLND
ncbi:7749_t:CDS:2, partial [Entrophospora sp. SA101]